LNQQCICITPKPLLRSTTKRLPKYNSRDWPSQRPHYLQFVLYKENKDTVECISLLSQFTGYTLYRKLTFFSSSSSHFFFFLPLDLGFHVSYFHLRVKRSNWLFAGNKDKRAVTSQLCTVFKYPAENLRVLNERLRGIKVGNYRYVDKPLELGDLLGNRFVVVLRFVHDNRSELFSPQHAIRHTHTHTHTSSFCSSLTSRPLLSLFSLVEMWKQMMKRLPLHVRVYAREVL
jgi:tRNA pseudouridine13 synthase